MSRGQQTVRRLLGIITLDQAYTTLSLPIITLIFFADDSRLFATDTPHAIRSIWYGTCIATPYLVNLFFAPVISALSDEFGRKKTLLFELSSAFFYTLVAGIGVYTGSLGLVVVSFIIRGAFSRTNTTALSIVGDVCDKHTKLSFMSYLQLAISLGACIGPLVGGLIGNHFYFTTLNYSLVFFVSACLASVNIALSYLYIDETLEHPNRQSVQSRWRSNLQSVAYVLTHPGILKISIILFALQISWSGFYQFIAPVLKTAYQFNAHSLGSFMGMVGFWLILGSGPVFKLLKHRLNPHHILNVGAALVLAGYAITIACYYHLIPGRLALWISAMIISVGDVITYICITTLYSNIVPSHMQGKVTGVNFLIIGMVWGSMSLIGGLLISYSIILPLIIAPTGATVALFAINTRNGRETIQQYSF